MKHALSPWDPIFPLLDACLEGLEEDDRVAVVLFLLESRSRDEVRAALRYPLSLARPGPDGITASGGARPLRHRGRPGPVELVARMGGSLGPFPTSAEARRARAALADVILNATLFLLTARSVSGGVDERLRRLRGSLAGQDGVASPRKQVAPAPAR